MSVRKLGEICNAFLAVGLVCLGVVDVAATVLAVVKIVEVIV